MITRPASAIPSACGSFATRLADLASIASTLLSSCSQALASWPQPSPTNFYLL
jgi:hypothetical protein